MNHKLKTVQFPRNIKEVNPHYIAALVHTNTSFECLVVKADLDPSIDWWFHNTSFKNVNDANLYDGIIKQVPKATLL